MDIFVTGFTLLGSRLEIHVEKGSFQVGRLVTFNAGDCSVRPRKRECRLRVIEAGQFFPRLGGVASFAPGNTPIGPHLLHAVFELSLVRIRMTTRTIQVRPVVDNRLLLLGLCRLLVAVNAGHREVCSGEKEMRLLVVGQGKSGRLVSFKIVTAIASVEVRRRDKLRRVPVVVAVRAVRELDLE